MTKTNEKLLREKFEASVPECLKRAEEAFRDHFEENELPELLKNHEETTRKSTRKSW